MSPLVPMSRRDRRKLFVGAGFFLSFLAVIAFIQANLLTGSAYEAVVTGPIWARLISGLAPALLSAVMLARLPESWLASVQRAVPGCLGVATVGAASRVVLQDLLHVYADFEAASVLLEFLVGFGVAFLTSIVLVANVWQDRRERTGQLDAAIARARAETAISALRDEEVRLGRVVADGLHGTLQQRLVLLNVQLTSMRDKLEQAGVDAVTVAEVTELAQQIDVLREETVRATSRLLAPEGVDIGLVPAVRLLLGRLPSSIRYSMSASQELRSIDDAAASTINPALRLLVVRVVEEALTNALRHGRATSFRVELSVVPHENEALRVEVSNDGVGFDPELIQLSGLSRLRSRVELAGGVLEVRSSTTEAKTGDLTTSVVATFPVEV